MILTRAQLAEAIKHWGEHGDDGIEHLKLTRQASALVTVLAQMDYHRQDTAALDDGSELARLADAALRTSAPL